MYLTNLVYPQFVILCGLRHLGSNRFLGMTAAERTNVLGSGFGSGGGGLWGGTNEGFWWSFQLGNGVFGLHKWMVGTFAPPERGLENFCLHTKVV